MKESSMCCPNRATPARPGYPARGRTGLPPHHPPSSFPADFSDPKRAASRGRWPSPTDHHRAEDPAWRAFSALQRRASPLHSHHSTSRLLIWTERETDTPHRHRTEHAQSWDIPAVPPQVPQPPGQGGGGSSK